ncbi:hypothetical protein F5884DRAFT_830164 [Xylogone sp. PMI_703]|nr:hypothetical protein F5884DRAFT_830164 [Xylogone sp. PMI_703]
MENLNKAGHMMEGAAQDIQAPSLHPSNPFFSSQSSPLPPSPRPAGITDPVAGSIFDVYADVAGPFGDSTQGSIFEVDTSPSTGNLRCTGSEPRLAKYTQFYVHKASAGFLICNYCYRVKVTPYQNLSNQFVPYRAISDDDSRTCVFFFPRILAAWRNECIPNHSLRSLLDFFQSVARYKPCDGSTITEPSPFYHSLDDSIPGLSICPRCFECFLRNTDFERYFQMIPPRTGLKWTCDMAQPYFQRLLNSFLEERNPSFSNFAKEVNLRLSMPACPGNGNPTTKFSERMPNVMFSTADGKGGAVCAACYSDCVLNTSLQHAFTPVQLPPERVGTLPCDLSSNESQMAMQFAIRKGDLKIWRNTVLASAKLTPCNGAEGVTEEDLAILKQISGNLADWYCLTTYPTIEVCPYCYWCKVQLFGAAHLFSIIDRPLEKSVVRQCYLTPSEMPLSTSIENCDNFETSLSWKGRRLLRAMMPGNEIDNWAPLLSAAKTIAMEPPPCGGGGRAFTRASGRRWFGRTKANPADENDCSIVFCEDCHSHTVKGARYANHYSTDLTDPAYIVGEDQGFICQTYTKRTRSLLREAAQTGQFQTFAQFWNYRAELKKKRDSWIPVIQAQFNQQQMTMMQTNQQSMMKTSAMASALHMKGAAGATEALIGFQGTQYGNSTIGFDHWTRSSANADMAWHQASNMQVNIGLAGSPIMPDSTHIFAQAQVDEEAFEAVE